MMSYRRHDVAAIAALAARDPAKDQKLKDPEAAAESRQRGARYYIEKPFRVGRIIQTVRNVMQRRP